MRSRALTAVPVFVALFAVTGCSGFSLYPPEEPVVEEQAPVMGNVEPSGEIRQDALGEYELVQLVNADDLTETVYRMEGVDEQWTPEQISAARAFALDYTVSQFFDSEALDTGSENYDGWAQNEAPNWFAPELVGYAADPATNVIMTNAGAPQVPQLIRDGNPRLNALTWQDETVAVGSHESYGIYFDFVWNVEALYRVSDASAVSFAAGVANYTDEEFLASGQPKEQLLDGEGENLYKVTSYMRLAVQETEAGLRLVGLDTQSDFSTEEFVHQTS